MAIASPTIFESMLNKIMPKTLHCILVSAALLFAAKLAFFPSNQGDVVSEIAQPSKSISSPDDIERLNDGPTIKVDDYLTAIEQEPFPLAKSVVVYGGQDYLEVGDAISISDFESKIYMAFEEKKPVGEYIDANENYYPFEGDSIQVNDGEFIDVDSLVTSGLNDSQTENVDRGPFIEINSLDESLGGQVDFGNDISIGEFVPLLR